MHPILFHVGHVFITTEGVLVALGLLAGLQLSCWLAPRLGLAVDRIWNLGVVSLLTLFLGQRMLVVALHLRDFIAHPFWMLGLTVVRDERYFLGGVLLAICAGLAYILAWQMPWRRVADCVAPGAGLALACASLGSLAAGTEPGRVTSLQWGVLGGRAASRSMGIPLGTPLVPLALYAALLHAVFAGLAMWLVLRRTRAGIAGAFWLFAAGLSSVLLGQLRYRFTGELLVGGLFTPGQVVGVVAVGLAAALWLYAPGPRTSTDALAAPGPDR